MFWLVRGWLSVWLVVGLVVPSGSVVFVSSSSSSSSLFSCVAGGVGAGSYDGAGGLAGRAGGGLVTFFGWDGSGNRVGVGGDGFVFDERNRLVSSSGGTHAWSARGTLLSVGSVSYDFDSLGRLVSAGPIGYTYDGLGRVATRGVQTFGYAGLSLDPSSDGVSVYGRSPGGGVVSVSDGLSSYLVDRDRHGDVTGLVGLSGVLAGSRSFDPFGVSYGSSGVAVNVGFQGDWTDPVSGHVWMGSRWYEGSWASFLSRDMVFGELSTPVGLNRYTYGFANPLSFWDPDGRFGLGVDGYTSVEGAKNAEKSAGKVASNAARARWVKSFLRTRGGVAAGQWNRMASYESELAVAAQASRGQFRGEQGWFDHTVGLFRGGLQAARDMAVSVDETLGAVVLLPVRGGQCLYAAGSNNYFGRAGRECLQAYENSKMLPEVFGQLSTRQFVHAGLDVEGVRAELDAGNPGAAAGRALLAATGVVYAVKGVVSAAAATRTATGVASTLDDPAKVAVTTEAASGELPSAVIGEGMSSRVVPYAEQNGYVTYPGVKNPANYTYDELLAHNRAQIENWMSEGRQIIDVGPEPGRAYYPMETSPNYGMEHNIIREYPGYQPTVLPGESNWMLAHAR